MPYSSDQNAAGLSFRLPLLTDIALLSDPATGQLYRCSFQDIKNILTATGNITPFVGSVGQTVYTNPALIGVSRIIVAVEGAVLAQGTNWNQYQFTAVTGTINFNQGIDNQTVNIYYFK